MAINHRETTMGDWRLQLFCCDLDLDLIQELNKGCGLLALEARHGKPTIPKDDAARSALRQAEHKMMAQKGPPEGKIMHRFPKPSSDSNNINFSVLAALCTHPDFVRRHLNTSGDFTGKMTALRGEALNARRGVLGGIQDPYGPGYMLCLLGACGMTLGVKVSQDERKAMRKYYKDCGLMRDAITQLEGALDEDTGYVNGVPWDYGSPAREDSMAAGGAPAEDLMFPGVMTNIWAPDHGREKGEMALMRRIFMQNVAQCTARPTIENVATALACLSFDPYASPRTSISSTEADAQPELFRQEAERLISSLPNAGLQAPQYGDGVCGSCGASSRPDSTALLICNKCKKRRYCSVDCQKQEWKDHKKICVTPMKLDPRGTYFEMR